MQAWEWETCYDLLSIYVLCSSLNWAFVSGRPVILYSSLLYVPVLACAGIGQDLAFSDFLTLFVCSRNIAMTSQKKFKKKKSICWKLNTLTPDQKTALCDLCKANLVNNKRSTTNLLRHLRLRHPFDIAACEEKQLKPVSMP